MQADPDGLPGDDGGYPLAGVSCVAWRGHGILVQGPSGSGKSDLCLRIIHEGGELVGDDVVRLRRDGSLLVATPYRDAGLIELRGQGIFRFPWRNEAMIGIVIRLSRGKQLERLPEQASVRLAGVDIPAFDLDASAPSAVARVAALLHHPRAF
ncbi:MAG: HPr kinase/phosphatase C-terminal domain-containing protein [Geminicoccaceae bacterium]